MCDVVWWDVHVMRCECLICDVVWWAIRPKNSAQELLLGVLFFRLVMCDVVRCDVWCLVRCNDVWCVMWWDFVYPAQELGSRTSSLCSLLSACAVWCVAMWCLMSGEMQWCVMCDVVRFRLSGPRTRPKNFFSVCSSFAFFIIDKCSRVRKHVHCGLWYHGPDIYSSCHGTGHGCFFFVFSSFGLCCVMWCDVMSDVWWDAMMCDVWCGEISSSGPRTRPKNFFSVCSSFALFIIDKCSRVRKHVHCGLWYHGPDIYSSCHGTGHGCHGSSYVSFTLQFVLVEVHIGLPLLSFSDYTVMEPFIAVRGVTTLFVLWLWFVGQVHKYVHSGPWHHHWKLFLFYYFTLFGVSCRDNVYIGIPYIKVALFSISTIRGTTQSIKCCVANRDIFPAFCSNVVGGVSAIEHTPSVGRWPASVKGEEWFQGSCGGYLTLPKISQEGGKYKGRIYIHPRYRYIKRWFVPYI